MHHQESNPGPQAAYHTIVGTGSSSVTNITSLERVYSQSGNNGASQASINIATQVNSSEKSNNQSVSIVNTPNKGAPVSNRKLSYQFVAPNSNKNNQQIASYNTNSKMTIDPQIQHDKRQKKNMNKFSQPSSKIIIEPLNMNNAVNVQ